MLRRVLRPRVVAGAILVLFAFALVPLVPYVQPVSVPGVYASGIATCLAGISQSNVTFAAMQRASCQEEYRSPPSYLLGFATAAYSLLEYGPPPFPSQKLISQGNHSALVFFDGGRAAAIEDAGPSGVALNPSGFTYFQIGAVSSFDFGFLNITFQMRNIGYYPITGAMVYLSMVGYSGNSSIGGLTLIQPKVVGNCGPVWRPSDYCQVSQIAPNDLPLNRSFSFYAEVRGSVKDRPFLYREGFGEDYPRGGVGPLWVHAFIDQVNNFRGGDLLSENTTLDEFAALRFRDASLAYQISEYNFSQDVTRFFGPNQTANTVGEELLFPGIFSPNNYPSFLSSYALGHWEGLVDPVYTQYGFYVGQASYYEVSVPCSVYEIPHPGINITQYFQDQGCLTQVLPATWLVVILAA